MKILLIHPFFYPHLGGSEKYAEELLATLAKNHEDVTIDVLTYNSGIAALKEVYRNFNITRIPCFTIIKDRFLLPQPINLFWALSKLAKNKYDFVYTHVRFFDPCWWGWLYAKAIGAKSIHTDHVAAHPAYQNAFVRIVGKIVDLTITKFSLERYDFLTTANNATKNFLVNTLRIKKEVSVVQIGVNTVIFKKTYEAERIVPSINLKIADETIVISYVGRLIWTKGVELLYEAFKAVKGSDVILVLAGSGELYLKLQDKIHREGLGDKILLLGAISYDQVRQLLGITDIFVNPSHHNEGLPTTILEAGSAGCCVIATDNGSTKEVVINGETGYLIPQKDEEALQEALGLAIFNTDTRLKYQTNMAKLIRENYDWVKIADDFFELISKK